MSGRPSVSPSMRRISWARAETALRPRAVSAPAWADRPVSSMVRQTAPLRADTTSPFSRAHSNTSAARAPAACTEIAGARRRTSSSAQTSSRSSWNGRCRAAQVSTAIAASTRPPFMSATPGPKQRIPSRRNGRAATVPAGNTVSVCPSSATTPRPDPGSAITMLRAGPSGSSTHSVRQPSGASQPASSSATRSCSTPPDGVSMSTSCCSLSQNVSITLEAVSLLAPGIGLVVVAVPLPEPGLVRVRELDAAQPLCALPEVAAGHQQP